MYIADVRDLRYWSAHGEMPEEALREILIAWEPWLKVAHEDGLSLPDPSAFGALPAPARKAAPITVDAA